MLARAFIALLLGASVAQAQLFTVGKRVRQIPSSLTLRSAAPPGGSTTSSHFGFSFGTVLDRAFGSDSAWWYSINWDTDPDGWVTEANLDDAGIQSMADLPYNVWKKLATVPSNHYVCLNYYDCTTAMNRTSPVERSYTGPTWGAGKMYYFGGGHTGYPGNDVEVFDPSTMTWTQKYTPEAAAACCQHQSGVLKDHCVLPNDCVVGSADAASCGFCLSGTPDTIVSPLGRPYTGHMYQKHAYDPGRNKFFVAVPPGFMGYDVPGDTWTNYTTQPYPNAVPNSGAIDTMLLFYDPTLQAFEWYLPGTTSIPGCIFNNQAAAVWQFDFTTGAFAKKTQTSVPAYPAANERAETYDPDNLQHLIEWVGVAPNSTNCPVPGPSESGYPLPRCQGRWRWYDAVNNTWGTQIVVPSWVMGPNYQWYNAPGSVAYDAGNHVFIFVIEDDPTVSSLVGSPVHTWLWNGDMAAPTWTELIVPTPVPKGPVRFGSMFYDSGYQATFLMNTYGGEGLGAPTKDTNVELWAFKYLPADATPAATPTATATSAATATATPACAGGGTLRLVGPTRALHKPSEAAAVVADNDCVDIDAGSYPGDVAVWTRNGLHLRGVGGTVKLEALGAVAQSKGIWVLSGNNTTVENIEFACATSRLNNTNCSGLWVGDDNDAGIRLNTGASGLTVRNCSFHDNDNGILGGTNGVGTVLIEQSEFFRNGYGDGYSHNVYIDGATLTFRYNYSHGALVGHELKTRAQTNNILYNRFSSEDGTGSVLVEIPYGGLSYVIGNVMDKGPLAEAGEFVKYAAEGGVNPTQELYVINNTMVSNFGSSVLFVRAYSAASPTVWVKNNIAYGTGTVMTCSGGSGCTSTEDHTVTADPLFFNPLTFNYHLTTGSPAIDAGADPGTVHSFSLTPTLEYVYDLSSQSRIDGAPLDAGAFAFTSFEVIIPTPTATPSRTSTMVLTPTRTPTANSFCPVGQNETVYAIAGTLDDGWVARSDTSYPPSGGLFQSSDGAFDLTDTIYKTLSGGTYSVRDVLWRWNTAMLSDGTAWPTNARATNAFVRPYWSANNTAAADARPVVFEWYAWTPPMSDSDWTATAPASSDPTYAAEFVYPVPMTNGFRTTALAHVDQVNRAGYTGMRVQIGGGQPTGANSLLVRPYDYSPSVGAQLIVCWQLTTIPPVLY